MKKPSTPTAALSRALANLREAENNGNSQNVYDLMHYLRYYGYRVTRIR
jgi:hypothetical protein